MNISSIVVQAKPEHIDDILEIVQNATFCDYHFHDKENGKIILTIEGENVDEEIKKLQIIQSLENVISAEMMMSYSEDELEREIRKLENQDPVPAMLNDDSLRAEDIVYHGDLRKKDIVN